MLSLLLDSGLRLSRDCLYRLGDRLLDLLDFGLLLLLYFLYLPGLLLERLRCLLGLLLGLLLVIPPFLGLLLRLELYFLRLRGLLLDLLRGLALLLLCLCLPGLSFLVAVELSDVFFVGTVFAVFKKCSTSGGNSDATLCRFN